MTAEDDFTPARNDFTLLFSKAAGLGRQIDGTTILVPSDPPRLVKGGLRCPSSLLVERRLTEEDRILDRFVQLASATDHEICAFAAEYGPLGICLHDLPAGHGNQARSILVSWRFCFDAALRNLPAGPCLAVNPEPIAAWRSYSKRAAALLKIAARLRFRIDRRIPEPLWYEADGLSTEILRSCGLLSPMADLQSSTTKATQWLRDPWWRLAENLNSWLELTGVAPSATPVANGFKIQFRGTNRGLFGLIAVQLLFACNRSEGLTICSACGRPYVSHRPPLAGKMVGSYKAKRNFCLECKRAGIPERFAARDYRKRKKKEHGK